MTQPRSSWRSHFHFALFGLSNWIRNFLISLFKGRQMILSSVKRLAEWLNGQLGADGKLNAIVLAGFIQNPRRWMWGIGRYQNQYVQILGLFAQRLAFTRKSIDQLGIPMVAFHDFFEHLTVLTIANRYADFLTMQIQFELLRDQIVKGMMLLSFSRFLLCCLLGLVAVFFRPRLTSLFYLINWVEPPNRNAALGIVRQGIVIGIPGQIDNIANIEFQFFLIKWTNFVNYRLFLRL